MKKKIAPAPKKKAVAAKPVPVPEAPKPKKAEPVNCDCGQPAHPGTPQCWACSHRT